MSSIPFKPRFKKKPIKTQKPQRTGNLNIRVLLLQNTCEFVCWARPSRGLRPLESQCQCRPSSYRIVRRSTPSKNWNFYSPKANHISIKTHKTWRNVASIAVLQFFSRSLNVPIRFKTCLSRRMLSVLPSIAFGCSCLCIWTKSEKRYSTSVNSPSILRKPCRTSSFWMSSSTVSSLHLIVCKSFSNSTKNEGRSMSQPKHTGRRLHDIRSKQFLSALGLRAIHHAIQTLFVFLQLPVRYQLEQFACCRIFKTNIVFQQERRRSYKSVLYDLWEPSSRRPQTWQVWWTRQAQCS